MSTEPSSEFPDYEDLANQNEELFLEDLEEARLQEHAAAIQHYVAAAEAETRETEVDSDEERSIVRGIREEITRQVRNEMALRGEHFRAPSEVAASEEVPDSVEMLAALDPRLREELERMRKLDKILLRKMRREREVKRSRLEQERRFRAELQQLEDSSGRDGTKMAKDVRNNMLKFLALKPPPKHNAGVYSEDSPPPTPVFQTEYLDGLAGQTPSEETPTPTTGSKEGRGRRPGARGGAQAGPTQRLKPDKDFIKRNIELAGMASEVVAMTEDERGRVDSLLADLESLPNSFETTAEESPDLANPFKVAVKPGEGFTLDSGLQMRMNEIDARLAQLLPPDDLESLRSATADSETASYQVTSSRQPR